VCDAGSWPATTTANTGDIATALKNDAWAGTAIAAESDTEWKKACCVAKATCATATCPAGYKADTTKTQVQCAGAECTAKEVLLQAGNVVAANNDGYNKECCSLDTTKCGGTATHTCPNNKYYPGDKAAAGTGYDADWLGVSATQGCCTAKATCANAKCPAGWKKKANVDQLSCSTGHASCIAEQANGEAKCCEKDVTTCGGLKGITCAYGTFDESATWTADTTQAVKDAWNSKAATEATKNTACCTAQAACQWEGASTTPAAAAATTTPAAVVTTTPAARLYSEHKVAIKDGQTSSVSNMVWLGAGCFIGMAVLMVAQALRSKKDDARLSAE